MEQNYKDTVFRVYFNEKPHLLSLLNALLKTNSNDPNEIEINTLDGLFFAEEGKNDISCLFRDHHLVLIEHQGTINFNMPLRCLFYVNELYKKIIEPEKNRIFKSKAIELPRPEFFVLYNGDRKAEDYQIMKLSDAFDGGGEINLELIVKQYNINAGHNSEFIEASIALKNYCTFVDRVKYNRSRGMSKDEAIAEALIYCVENNVMVDFLLNHRRELSGMYWFEYDKEAAKIEREKELDEERAKFRAEFLAEGRAEGIVEGIAKGEQQGKFEIVKNLLNEGMNIEFIKKVSGWTEEQILKIAVKN